MMFRSTDKVRLCIYLLGFLAAGVAVAQSPATLPAGPISPVPRVPEYAATDRVPGKLLNDQAGQAILLPSEPGEYGEESANLSGGALAKITAETKPLPDGYAIGRRPGRIQREGGGFVVHLDHIARMPDAPPLRILPNARLALLESFLADGSQDKHRFLVTGRITEFQGANYILLDHLSEQVATGETPSPQPVVTPTVEPVQETETRPSGREPSAEELVRQLMRDKPTRTKTFAEETKKATATAPAEGLEQPLPEPTAETGHAHWSDETLLSDRQARIVPSGPGAWMLAFEDPGRNADRPIRILPGRLLETALNLTAGGTKPVVLIVSGEVTAHRSANYVLLRKVLVRRNMGNLQ